ncbi:MAG: (2Fe-2S)-binding protein [Eubacteriales bacterium]|nr:(2Fe-2S)-binding protein [Eubacteriales bacterium]
MEYCVKFCVNDEPVELTVSGNETLLHVLRERLGLTGTKEGCGAGECGACTIIMNGQAVNACLVLAPEVNGKVITTVEGLAHGDELSPLQEAFVDHMALQCGFCTPGMLMSAEALLRENPTPTRDEITHAMSGNLCRCTGYKKIVEAIEDVIAKGVYQK